MERIDYPVVIKNGAILTRNIAGEKLNEFEEAVLNMTFKGELVYNPNIGVNPLLGPNYLQNLGQITIHK